jgi:hypothetical protein
MQSICDQLLFEKSTGQRELRNLKFVWIERDPILVQEVNFIKSKEAEFKAKDDPTIKVEQQVSSYIGSEGIVTRLMSLIPPGETSDAELEELYADGGLPSVDDAVSFVLEDDVSACAPCPPLEVVMFDNMGKSVKRGLYGKPDIKPTKPVLDMQIYLTGDAKPSGPVPFARFGRPDIKILFEEMRSDALASGDQKVAVCVSAPHKLMSLCHRACVLYSDDKVRFDFHSEAMAI